MMMRSWLARPLRRFLFGAAMVVAGHDGLYRVHHMRPELPPSSVDRVEVATFEGSHTITHRATVDRILAIVRSGRGEWTRYPDAICLLGTPRAAFYEGTAQRSVIVLGPRAIGVQSRHAFSSRVLSPQDAAELERLLKR
jgi:hypothetical protein